MVEESLADHDACTLFVKGLCFVCTTIKGTGLAENAGTIFKGLDLYSAMQFLSPFLLGRCPRDSNPTFSSCRRQSQPRLHLLHAQCRPYVSLLDLLVFGKPVTSPLFPLGGYKQQLKPHVHSILKKDNKRAPK